MSFYLTKIASEVCELLIGGRVAEFSRDSEVTHRVTVEGEHWYSGFARAPRTIAQSCETDKEYRCPFLKREKGL